MIPVRMSDRSLRTLLACYLVVIACVTLWPFEFVSSGEALSRKVERIKWVPFRDPRTGGVHSPRDTAANIAMYVPLGVVGCLLMRRGKAGSRTARQALARVLLLAGASSLLIEVMQLFTEARVTNVTDVLANSIGACLGGVLASWFQRRGRRASVS
jgi:glycopeptide antibiotics resistance protein